VPKPQRKPYPDAIVPSPTNVAQKLWRPGEHQLESEAARTPQPIITAHPSSWRSSMFVGAIILGMFGTIIYFLGWKATIAILLLILVALVAWGNYILDHTTDR
jgi:hypothetical protein